MSVPRDFERLLEGYVSGSLAPHERAVVDEALEGRDPSVTAAEARAALAIEEALSRSLQVAPFEGDVAGRVLARVYRRPERTARGPFEPGLAHRVLEEARAGGRIQPSRPRRRRANLARVARPVVVAAVFFGLMWVGLHDFRQGERPGFDGGSRAAIGELAYVSARAEAIEALPVARGTRRVYAGSRIETGPEQVAVVTLPDGGRFIVKPDSRVRVVVDDVHATVRLDIERGGVRTELGEGSLQFGSGTACDGRIGGEGEITLASDALGGGRPVLAPGLASSMMVSVQDGGRAVFRCNGDELAIESEEVGVVGEGTLIKLQRKDGDIGPIPARDWDLDRVVDDPRGIALEVDKRELDRGRIARELFRSYREELLDMLLKTRVIEAELARRALTVPEGNQRLAAAIVESDELMQAMPMRSSLAAEARRAHVAGLLTLAGDGAVPAGATEGEGGARLCRELWSSLAAGVRIAWMPSGSDELFRIRREGSDDEIPVTLAEAWDALRSYLRVSEVRTTLDELARRIVVETWLRAQGGAWPAPAWKPDDDPARREAQTIFIHLSGLTLRRYADRMQLQSVIEAYVPEPAAAEVERYLEEEAQGAGRVLFEHWFFPTAGAERGLPNEMPQRAEENAAARAASLVEALRRGETPKPGTTRFGPRGSIWQARWATGPAPWWDEVYGPAFGEAVLGLAAGEVSGAVRGHEGYHVVRVRETAPPHIDAAERRARARRMLKIERARALIDEIVAEARRESAPPEDLLR